MVSGEGAAASNLTHGSMRRGSIAGILRKLGLSHYTKTQVDEKVATALLAYTSNVAPADVTATYATITYVDEAVKKLEASIARLDEAGKTYATNETLGNYPTLQVMSDADGAVAAANVAITSQMSGVIIDHQTLIETHSTAISELQTAVATGISELQTAVETDISELQTAVDAVGSSVIHHRSTFDNMVSRQAGEDGAWDDSEPVNGNYVFASYLEDNEIPFPTFDWPWRNTSPPTPPTITPAYEHTYNIFMTATTAGSDDVILINMAQDWGQLYGKTCFVSGNVLIGGAPLAIHGERTVLKDRVLSGLPVVRS